MKWLNGFIALAMVSAAVPANAEGDARIILGQLNDAKAAELGRMAIYMAYTGMLWSNAYLANQGSQQSFCIPAKLAVEPEQVESIFRHALVDRPDLIDKPAGMVLLFGMVATFPCQ